MRPIFGDILLSLWLLYLNLKNHTSLSAFAANSITMSVTEGLVDLSLFDWAPTSQHHPNSLNIGATGNSISDHSRGGIQEYYGPRPQPHISSLDRTSPRRDATKIPETSSRSRICHQGAHRCDDGSQCILKRIRRTGTSDCANSPSALLQRRNLPAAPQLTLSVPHSNQESRPPASSMVWIPDEQMWLVITEVEQSEHYAPRTDYPAPTAYPTPPQYTPRAYPRSEPSTQTPSDWNLTTPRSSVQYQLQSLLHPRDEERLSPLFQEAMNSVPLTDHFDLPPPPSYEGTMRREQRFSRVPAHDRDSLVSSLTPTDAGTPIQRARTTTGHRGRIRAQSSTQRSSSQRDSTVSGYSTHLRSQTSVSATRAQFPDEANLSVNSRPWFGLARKIARPSSAT